MSDTELKARAIAECAGRELTALGLPFIAIVGIPSIADSQPKTLRLSHGLEQLDIYSKMVAEVDRYLFERPWVKQNE